MQLPTNYRMGTGLAATIMGQQAGLEAEQQGLANLMKGMQMPAEALKGQEAAMLMQNPEYLQQKTANTLIELKNQYSASDFQQTLDAANRVRIKLDAAAGDPAKEQQIVQESLAALKIDPNSEFAQYAMKDPRGALTKFIQGVEVGLTGTGGAKHFGKMAEQAAQDTASMEREKYKGGIDLQQSRISADATRYNADAMAANKDTQALINTENNLRQRVAQYDTTIERYARGDADAEIIANIRKADPKKSEKQVKSEVKLRREETVKTLRAERDGLVKRADEIGDAVTGRLKLGQKAPTNTGGSAPPPPSGYKPI